MIAAHQRVVTVHEDRIAVLSEVTAILEAQAIFPRVERWIYPRYIYLDIPKIRIPLSLRNAQAGALELIKSAKMMELQHVVRGDVVRKRETAPNDGKLPCSLCHRSLETGGLGFEDGREFSKSDKVITRVNRGALEKHMRYRCPFYRTLGNAGWTCSWPRRRP